MAFPTEAARRRSCFGTRKFLRHTGGKLVSAGLVWRFQNLFTSARTRHKLSEAGAAVRRGRGRPPHKRQDTSENTSLAFAGYYYFDAKRRSCAESLDGDLAGGRPLRNQRVKNGPGALHRLKFSAVPVGKGLDFRV